MCARDWVVGSADEINTRGVPGLVENHALLSGLSEFGCI